MVLKKMGNSKHWWVLSLIQIQRRDWDPLAAVSILSRCENKGAVRLKRITAVDDEGVNPPPRHRGEIVFWRNFRSQSGLSWELTSPRAGNSGQGTGNANGVCFHLIKDTGITNSLWKQRESSDGGGRMGLGTSGTITRMRRTPKREEHQGNRNI